MMRMFGLPRAGYRTRTIPKVKAARTSDEYRTAIDEIPLALDDPETTTAEMS
jgi:antitoxin component HigA of HigAB toxin-antitoxin module